MQYEFLNHPELVSEYQSATLVGESVIDFRVRVFDANIFNLGFNEHGLYFMELIDYNAERKLVPGCATLV